MAVPKRPMIYHITHFDRLPSIVGDGGLNSDADISRREPSSPVLGIAEIKLRRLRATLKSHSGLTVGMCVPFYFCPRSVMLYLLYRGNHQDLAYRGGQDPIIHLEADLSCAVNWADSVGLRWAFTLSNAGAGYFEDRSDLGKLNELQWDAISTTKWSGDGVPYSVKEGKQAEFLMEKHFPWHLVERIGVHRQWVYQQVARSLPQHGHRPRIEIKPDWYY